MTMQSSPALNAKQNVNVNQLFKVFRSLHYYSRDVLNCVCPTGRVGGTPSGPAQRQSPLCRGTAHDKQPSLSIHTQ